MSAAIHSFPGRDPNRALLDPADDLLAELAVAVGSRPLAAGEPVRPFPGTGHRATVHPIARARRGGANDLVTTERGVGVRRHHLVLVAVTVALALAFALLTTLVGASADGDVPIAGTTTLEGGETLWGIAADITPAGGDVRETVAVLLEANDFDSPTVPTGTLVRLPDLAD